MIKAVIYDMDDLMVNSDHLHQDAWDILLKKYGHKFSDIPKEIHPNFIGMRVIDVSKEIIKILNLDTDLQPFYKERISTFLEIVKEKLETMPALNESLELFKKNNYKLALASSGAMEYINLVLDKFNIRSYFDEIVSGDDVSKGKPDPEPYIIASRKIGVEPSECLVLEDATKGIESAKSAGCKCIAIRNLYTAPQDYSKADKTLDSLSEITLDIVNSL